MNRREVSMPTDCAIRRLSTEARTRAPKRVRSSPSHNAVTSAAPQRIRKLR